MLGKLANDQIDYLLRSEMVGRLGCQADGMVYVVPLSYAYKSGNIYIHTVEGQKIDMMRMNPNVVFEIDRIVDLNNWQSVVINGIYKELKGKEADEAMRILASRFMPFNTSKTVPSKYGMEKIHSGHGTNVRSVVFKICELEKNGRYEKT